MNVLITGANRGLGAGFVRYYLKQGAEVWACYRTALGELAALKNPRLHHLRWDVRQHQSAEQLQAAGVPERLDLLINNAGIYNPNAEGDQSLDEVAAATMLEVFDVDCVGPLRVVQALKSRLVKGRGMIANLSSKMGSSADNSSGGEYAYRAAKAALVIVSKSMAIDLAPQGVRVITLHPGWVRTDMTQHEGLIDVSESVAGMAGVIEHIADYELGAFVAYDGKLIPF